MILLQEIRNLEQNFCLRNEVVFFHHQQTTEGLISTQVTVSTMSILILLIYVIFYALMKIGMDSMNNINEIMLGLLMI